VGRGVTGALVGDLVGAEEVGADVGALTSDCTPTLTSALELSRASTSRTTSPLSSVGLAWTAAPLFKWYLGTQ